MNINRNTIIEIFEKAKSQVEWTSKGFMEPNANWYLRVELDKFLTENSLIEIMLPYCDSAGNCCGQTVICKIGQEENMIAFNKIFNEVAKDTVDIYRCYLRAEV